MPFVNPPPTGLPLQPPQVPNSISAPTVPAVPSEIAIIGQCKIKWPPLPPLPFGFQLPKFPFSFPPALPEIPLPAVPYNCLLVDISFPPLGSFPSNNPFDYSDVPAGGGRVSNQLPDPDAAFDTTETP